MCPYLHRLPNAADEAHSATDFGADIFGREKRTEENGFVKGAGACRWGSKGQQWADVCGKAVGAVSYTTNGERSRQRRTDLPRWQVSVDGAAALQQGATGGRCVQVVQQGAGACRWCSRELVCAGGAAGGWCVRVGSQCR